MLLLFLLLLLLLFDYRFQYHISFAVFDKFDEITLKKRNQPL